MGFTTAITLFSLAALSVGQILTGPLDCAPAGNYNLCQNLWGRDSGVGSQSSTLVSTDGNAVSWSTNYTWANGPNAVKSYANVESTVAKGVQLQDVVSAPTTWSWTYETRSEGIRADVAYDIWTGVPPTGTPASANSSFEIMIWLSGVGGIQPVGSPVTTGISLVGHTWDLWRGPNSNWEVLSFVAKDGEIEDFNVDLKDFFEYIIDNQSVAPTQYIQSIQAGTEPFTGTANLITTSYSVAIATA